MSRLLPCLAKYFYVWSLDLSSALSTNDRGSVIVKGYQGGLILDGTQEILRY